MVVPRRSGTGTSLAKPTALDLLPWIAVAAVALAIFIADLVLVKTGTARPDDRSSALAVHHTFGTASDPFFRAMSLIGNGAAQVVIAMGMVAVLVFLRRTGPAIIATIVVTGAALLETGIKLVVARPRPHLFAHAVAASGYSFPSGHATNSFALTAIAVYFVAVLGVARRWVWVAAVLGALFTGLVGLSRVVLGVHYPTDVIGGYALCCAWLALACGLLPALGRRYRGTVRRVVRTML